MKVLFSIFILIQFALITGQIKSNEEVNQTNKQDDIQIEKDVNLNNSNIDNEKKQDESNKNDQNYQYSSQQNQTQSALNETNLSLKGSQIKNFTEFPIQIGTYDTSFDVYRAGQINNAYKKVPNARVIPDNEDAEIFYISFIEEHFNNTLLDIKYPEVIYENENLKVNINVPRIKDKTYKKPLDILLVFECQKQSSSFVTLLLDLNYGDVNQKIPINFIKECGKPRVNTYTNSTFFGDLIYYSICCLGIFIGFYLTKLFKNSLMKNNSVSTFGLDTSYKRKYDKMSELPERASDIQNQL